MCAIAPKTGLELAKRLGSPDEGGDTEAARERLFDEDATSRSGGTDDQNTLS